MLHLKSRKKPYNLTLKENYKKYRNNILSNAKYFYYSNKIKQCNNDTKRIWNTIYQPKDQKKI